MATFPIQPRGHGAPISLQPMRSLLEAKEPDDDWTGLTARKERKKRQNRLNQRASRRRREANAASAASRSSSSPSNPPTPTTQIQPTTKPFHLPPTNQPPKALALFTPPSQRPFHFPLSTDHLMLLIQYNFYRGCLSNMAAVGVTSPGTLILSIPRATAPSTFTPTVLQRTVPHAAWIDSIPHPVLRDNFVSAQGSYDGDEFWEDAVGTLHEAYEGKRPGMGKAMEGQGKGLVGFKMEDGEGCGDEGLQGMMCWSDPWIMESYEISPKLLRKWWGLMGNCEALLRGTNNWRVKRGEEPLRFEEIIGE